MQLDPALPASEPGTLRQGVPIDADRMGQPLKQPQRDHTAQCFQRRIRQAPVRLVFNTQGGELIDVDQHRRQDQQRQRPIGQAVDFARHGWRLGLSEQQVVRVHLERFAQLGANDRQDFRRAPYQPCQCPRRGDAARVGKTDLIDQATGMGIGVDPPFQLLANRLRVRLGSEVRVVGINGVG